MKSSASKRVLFLIIFLFVLLLGGVAYYFKDVISNGIKYGRWFTVDKHEELFDYCDYKKDGGELKIKCKGLVKSVSVSKENKKDICYNILVISKVGSSLVDYKICEKPDKIDFTNPYKDLEMVVPVNFEILFLKDSFSKYNVNKSTLALLSEQEMKLILERVNENELNTKIGMGRWIAGRLNSVSAYKGLCCEVDLGLVSSNSIMGFLILNAKIIGVSFSNELVNLNISTHFQGSKKEYLANLSSKAFSFVKKDGTSDYITSSNFNLIPLGAIYDIQVSYPTTTFIRDEEETKIKCANDYIQLSNIEKSICDNILTLKFTKEEENLNIKEFERKMIQSSDNTVKIENVFINFIHSKL